MKSDFQCSYSALCAEVRQYIAQEYPTGGWLNVSEDCYQYFKALALQEKRPAASVALSPPPIQTLSRGAPTSQSQVHRAHVVPANPSPSAVIAPQPLKLRSTHPVPVQTPSFPVSAGDTKMKTEGAPLPSEDHATRINKRAFALEPPSPVEPIDFSALRKMWQELFPLIPILDAIPQPNISQNQIAQVGSPAVIVLCFHEGNHEKTFLANVTAAINHNLAPAQLVMADTIEQRQGWESLLQNKSLKLIVASLHPLHARPTLLQYYREESSNGSAYLGNILLTPLAELTHYMTEPRLKIKLWNTLCDILSRRTR